MNVLAVCEESQAVTIEMRDRGHNAFSCDIKPCTGGHPEWHLEMDAFDAIKMNQWDLIVAFPPCTHLAVSGASWFEKKRNDGRQHDGIVFFMELWNATTAVCDHVAFENPVGIISGEYIPRHFPHLALKYGLPFNYTQKIQPFYFGDSFQKTTCLWLHGLPMLYHNAVPNLFDQTVTHVDAGEFVEWVDGRTGQTKRMAKWYNDARRGDHGTERSKTFPGIATAMAEQWPYHITKTK